MLCVLFLVAAIVYITVFLYAAANCPSLSVHRLSHWLTIIYKSILGLLPTYLCLHMCKNLSRYGLRSQDIIQMQAPRVRTELGKKDFKFFAPSTWNDVQKDLKLSDLITMGKFKSILKDREISSCDCPV